MHQAAGAGPGLGGLDLELDLELDHLCAEMQIAEECQRQSGLLIGHRLDTPARVS